MLAQKMQHLGQLFAKKKSKKWAKGGREGSEWKGMGEVEREEEGMSGG
jgi:hypothetical protein